MAKKKIIFHLCCGPCGTASVAQLKADGYDPICLYYNPNIHPRSEYEKRKREAAKLAKAEDFDLIEDDYRPEQYHAAVAGLEDNQPERCLACWELRITRAAKLAQEKGIPAIGTSLRISPYQDQDRLLALGERIAREHNLSFYDFPLSNLYRDSIKRSKELEMYRQKYCGCVYSKEGR